MDKNQQSPLANGTQPSVMTYPSYQPMSPLPYQQAMPTSPLPYQQAMSMSPLPYQQAMPMSPLPYQQAMPMSPLPYQQPTMPAMIYPQTSMPMMGYQPGSPTASTMPMSTMGFATMSTVPQSGMFMQQPGVTQPMLNVQQPQLVPVNASGGAFEIKTMEQKNMENGVVFKNKNACRPYCCPSVFFGVLMLPLMIVGIYFLVEGYVTGTGKDLVADLELRGTEGDCTWIYSSTLESDVTCHYKPETTSCSRKSNGDETCSTTPSSYYCVCPVLMKFNSSEYTQNYVDKVSVYPSGYREHGNEREGITPAESINIFGIDILSKCQYLDECGKFGCKFDECQCSFDMLGHPSVFGTYCDREDCGIHQGQASKCTLMDGSIYGGWIEQIQSWFKSYVEDARLVAYITLPIGLLFSFLFFYYTRKCCKTPAY